MDGGWLLLLAIAMRDSTARPFASLLLASWFLSYFLIAEGGDGLASYAASAVFDAWAMLCGLVLIKGDRRTRGAVWPYVVVALWCAWLAMQAAYWWNRHHGVDLGLLAYHGGRWIFTAQAAACAWAGLMAFWRDARAKRRRV